MAKSKSSKSDVLEQARAEIEEAELVFGAIISACSDYAGDDAHGFVKLIEYAALQGLNNAEGASELLKGARNG
ncbi:MAG TPA: hypothetical protein VED01_13310 [Burkholderiales bacterium]|nr:hypothetical protein [Burkholderiales bacterium]